MSGNVVHVLVFGGLSGQSSIANKTTRTQEDQIVRGFISSRFLIRMDRSKQRCHVAIGDPD